MSTENDNPTNGDNANEHQPEPAAAAQSAAAGESAAATAPSVDVSATPDAPAAAEAPAPESSSGDDDDAEESRGGGDAFDFGAMLDQYEQEQAQYQEGSVVRGTVVGVTERSVVIDFGFKSEGAVPIEEFMEAGELTVKRGDEVEVLIKSMESQEGVPI